jgi:CheY-like chemotaxis protein/nitrogen-specific signal transduction histidine kinase
MTTLGKVLIIDDEPIARESLEALLLGENYELHFADHGSEGLQKAKALQPDAILLDVMMPGMDGFEVCRRLRDDSDLEQVAIIMITALDDRSSRLAGLRAGADEFLSKPFDSVELKTRLQTITRLGRYRRLVAERNRLEWIVEQSEEGYVLLDDGGRIRYVNPRARHYLGLPQGVDGQDFMQTARRMYRLEPTAGWEQWEVTGTFATPCYLVQPETLTARAFWLQADGQGSPNIVELGRIIRLRDVTAQMSSYQDMRRFHTTVVHKLRTPLIAMHGSFTLLANYGGEMSADEVEEFARTALTGIERLKSEIDDILQYINAPVLALSGDTMTFAEFCARVVEQTKQLEIQEFDLQYDQKIDHMLMPLTPQALDTILWELLENAVKFHPSKSPHVQLEVSFENERIMRLALRDNGVVLSPEQLRTVWTPYIQGEKYFTGESPGMGLGLSLVATLVWQVGGEVHLANREDGKGVQVTLRLPLPAILNAGHTI